MINRCWWCPTVFGSAIDLQDAVWCTVALSALRFFFAVTLGRAELALQLARVHYPRKLQRVPSPEEVGRLLEAKPGPGLKYKAALSIAYGAGLSAGGVVMLRVGISTQYNRPSLRRGRWRTSACCFSTIAAGSPWETEPLNRLETWRSFVSSTRRYASKS
jgi:hypothetical protein